MVRVLLFFLISSSLGDAAFTGFLLQEPGSPGCLQLVPSWIRRPVQCSPCGHEDRVQVHHMFSTSTNRQRAKNACCALLCAKNMPPVYCSSFASVHSHKPASPFRVFASRPTSLHCSLFLAQVCKHRLASVSRLLTVLAGAISSLSIEVVGLPHLLAERNRSSARTCRLLSSRCDPVREEHTIVCYTFFTSFSFFFKKKKNQQHTTTRAWCLWLRAVHLRRAKRSSKSVVRNCQ